MRSEQHRGFMLWGHAILQQREILHPERYAASGTITKDNKVVEASGVLGEFETEEDAESGRYPVGACLGGQFRMIRDRGL